MKVDRAKLRTLVTLTVGVEPEPDSIEGFACATDDPDADARLCALIHNERDRGNEWAWCVVGVEVAYNGYQGASYLGGTSYLWEYSPDPAAAWRADNYDQQLDEAIEDLAQRIEHLTDRDAARAKIARIEADCAEVRE